jgi:hypothetical protein
MFLAAPGWTGLQEMAETARDGDGGRRLLAVRLLDQTLARIGLLAAAPAAVELIGYLAAWGFAPGDPPLEILQLNAALSRETGP